MRDEEIRLETENTDLRHLLAQAGIDAAEHKVADQLQRILLEELHHRVKNTLAMVQAVVSQSLRSAENVEQGRKAIESRLGPWAGCTTYFCGPAGAAQSWRSYFG
jgi:two-component sensor histidine kinase